MHALRTATLLLVAGFLLACAPAEERYRVEGTVTGVLRDGRELIVDHEQIPGFMEAMEMRFDVAEDEQVRARTLATGARLRFDLVTTGEAMWIENLEPL